jgi:hypothetical protein
MNIVYQLPLATSEAGLLGASPVLISKIIRGRKWGPRTWFRRREFRDAELEIWVFFGIKLGRDKNSG